MPLALAFPSTLALCAERLSLFFCLAVESHCVLPLLSFFMSALVESPAEYIHLFEGATALDELDVLHPLPAGIYHFATDVRLFCVIKLSQFD